MEWTYVPTYLFSFIRFNSRRKSMEKYFTESGIRIPYKDFRDFVYERAFHDYAVSLFSTEEELKKNLSLGAKMNYLKMDDEAIAISPEMLKAISMIVRNQVRDLRNVHIADYSKELVRRIYLASALESDKNDAELLQYWQRRELQQVDNLIISDQDTYEKVFGMRYPEIAEPSKLELTF